MHPDPKVATPSAGLSLSAGALNKQEYDRISKEPKRLEKFYKNQPPTKMLVRKTPDRERYEVTNLKPRIRHCQYKDGYLVSDSKVEDTHPGAKVNKNPLVLPPEPTTTLGKFATWLRKPAECRNPITLCCFCIGDLFMCLTDGHQERLRARKAQKLYNKKVWALRMATKGPDGVREQLYKWYRAADNTDHDPHYQFAADKIPPSDLDFRQPRHRGLRDRLKGEYDSVDETFIEECEPDSAWAAPVMGPKDVVKHMVTAAKFDFDKQQAIKKGERPKENIRIFLSEYNRMGKWYCDDDSDGQPYSDDSEDWEGENEKTSPKKIKKDRSVGELSTDSGNSDDPRTLLGSPKAETSKSRTMPEKSQTKPAKNPEPENQTREQRREARLKRLQQLRDELQALQDHKQDGEEEKKPHGQPEVQQRKIPSAKKEDPERKQEETQKLEEHDLRRRAEARERRKERSREQPQRKPQEQLQEPVPQREGPLQRIARLEREKEEVRQLQEINYRRQQEALERQEKENLRRQKKARREKKEAFKVKG